MSDTDLIMQRLDQMDRRNDERFLQIDKRADERHAALLAQLNDHEERLRTLERGQQRGVIGDGAAYIYTTLASVIQYLLIHRGP